MYQIRPGIVLVNICDRYYLVAMKKARQYCKYMTRINESAAFVWQMMEKKMTLEEITGMVIKEFDTDSHIDEEINQLVENFKGKGYITTGE